jgi:pimeloyl-ACP methyl ester carboxylesterase
MGAAAFLSMLRLITRLVLSLMLALVAFALAKPVPTFAEDRSPFLPLPHAATVLTLSGLNFNLTRYMPRQFGGVFARPPYTMREVRYPASLASDSISKGVAALDAALRTTSGPVIVLAHSQGAQVASHWMRQHADDPTAPSSDRLVFLLTGNPLRREGGYIVGRREVGGTIGLPTPVTTRWRVIDVARRYDGWADWPADETNRPAVAKARAGMFTVHKRYDAVSLHDPSNTVWTRGTTTFVLTREEVQPHIEQAYRRPTSLNAPGRTVFR